MLGRINRIISLFLVVALFVYVVIINANPITVFVTPRSSITAYAGVFLIGAFWIGVFFAGTIATVLGVRAYIRERRLHAQERSRQAFLDSLLRARSFSASHEWPRAQAEWERLIARDPTDVLARIELSRCLEASGDLREALKILDQARAAQPENTEVLVRAAELNVALGNKTAAVDNLALVLYNRPNRHAAAMARDLSRELGRLDDALEYQRQLEDLGDDSDGGQDLKARAEYMRILDARHNDPVALRNDLRSFNKKFALDSALEKLAELEQAAHEDDEAAQALIKLARRTKTVSGWGRVANFWLSRQLPERALSTWKLAHRELSGTDQLKAHQELARAYLSLNMLDDARRELDSLKNASANETLTSDLSIRQTALEGLYYYKRGAFDRSAALWDQIFEPNHEKQPLSGAFQTANGPSPVLSTP